MKIGIYRSKKAKEQPVFERAFDLLLKERNTALLERPEADKTSTRSGGAYNET